MIQSTFPSNRRQKVSAIRDFPPGCGTQLSDENQRNGIVSEDDGCVSVADRDNHRPKEDKSIELVMKKAGFNVAASGSNAGIRKLVSAKRTFPPSSDSKVKPLSPEETIELVASQSKRIRSASLGNSERMQIQRNSLEKMKNMSYVVAPTDQARPIPVAQTKNQAAEVLSPREKVLKALRLFKIVFRELDRDKAARRGESKTGTSRIDYQTRSVLVEMNKQVNGEKMIGSVPGIKVGDEFQYKAQLNIIGLHFCIMGGIDYMNSGELKLATSIVASEGYGYNDRFESDVVIYTGEGGNVINKDQNLVEDQKLVKGNLALANSMNAKTEVRVIRGINRLDQKRKHYVYDGLYLVNDYWRERGPQGNMLFKFKLTRVPGQPPVDWKKHIVR